MTISPEKTTLQKMFYFQGIVKHGSMRSAALSLNVPVSTLSYEIKSLERLLGTSLVATDKNKLTLTQDGRKFAAFTADVIQNFQNLQLGGIEDHISEIAIASEYGICELYIPQIIDLFVKQYPNIKIIVKAGPEFTNFTSSCCDVVIGPQLANRPDLSQTFLKEFQYYLYASKRYLQARSRPESMEDLKDHDLLLYDATIAPYRQRYQINGVKVDSNNYRTLLEFGKLGHGIFPLTQEGFQGFFNNHSDFVRLFDTASESESYYFIYNKHSPKLMMIKKIKEITEQLINQGGKNG